MFSFKYRHQYPTVFYGGITALLLVTIMTITSCTRSTPSFDQMTETILTHVVTQESQKDATCWTTARQMDGYFVGTSINEEAAILKVEAAKALVIKLWQTASVASQTDFVSNDILMATLPDSLIAQLDTFETPSHNTSHQTALTHYHRITENWRILLSILMNQSAKVGPFQSGYTSLKPLSQNATHTLAKITTIIILDLLQHSSQEAKVNHHQHITLTDIQSAYTHLNIHYQLTRIANTQPYSALLPSIATANLRTITQQNIAQKQTALMSWNQAQSTVTPQTIMTNINRIIPIPFTQSAIDELIKELRILSDYLSLGYLPQRQDLYYGGTYRLFFERPYLIHRVSPNVAYLSLEHVQDVLTHAFPKWTDQKGDVHYHQMPAPFAEHPKPLNHYIKKTVLKAFHCDAFRDTGIHWFVMGQTWSNPNTLPLDPFAAELIAERLSELATFISHHAVTAAQKDGTLYITKDHIKAIIDPSLHWMPPPQQHYQWTSRNITEKSLLFSQYRSSFFTDISHTQSYQHPLVNVAPKSYNYLRKSIGHGISTVDINQDGLIDLFLPGQGGNQIYLNRGNFQFKRTRRRWHIKDPLFEDARHAVFTDIDNDGLLDAFIVHSETPSQLFKQTSKGIFKNITQTSGIHTQLHAISATFFDYNNDGYLDLFVSHYGPSNTDHFLIKDRPDIAKLPDIMKQTLIKELSKTTEYVTLDGRNGELSQLYHNNGDGTFTYIPPEQSGLTAYGFALAASAFDFNLDGHQDLYIANDYGPNELFLNQGNGTFKDIAKATNSDDRGGGMNVAFSDINHDGYMDLYVTVIDMFSKNMGFKFPTNQSTFSLDDHITGSSFYLTGNKLFQNQHGQTMTAIEHTHMEPGDYGWGWSAMFGDVDNDTDEDLYITNGYYNGSLAAQQPNILLLQQNNYFYKAPTQWNTNFTSNSRTVIPVDFNNNGKLDLVVSNLHDNYVTLQNHHPSPGNWLKIKLKGTTQNRFGVGAQITIHLPTKRLTRLVTSGTGYLGQSPYVKHFGLGTIDTINQISIRWPNGHLQTVPGPIQANQTLVITEK